MKTKEILLTALVITLIATGTLFAKTGQDEAKDTGCLYAETQGEKTYPSHVPKYKKGSTEKLGKALRIRHEMREMEKSAIENDAKLKSMVENIEKLHKQLQEKLDAKMKNNTEYQEKKKELDAMKEEWHMKPNKNKAMHGEMQKIKPQDK